MKGIELPINILVIVAIAVIVLLGMIALYFTGWGPFAGATSLEGIKNTACRQLVQTSNCGISSWTILVSNFDANKDGNINPLVGAAYPAGACPIAGTGDNLAQLCLCYYSRTKEAECRTLCGCPGV